jgi:diguanylate cyclase (GGDEF)-like protein
MINAKSFAVPVRESDRLRALWSYEILDTEPEGEYDALCRLASHTFGVPTSLISMVDEKRVWFKSRRGFALPEVSRAEAFAAYAVLAPHEIMVVANMRHDSRFAAHPMVIGSPRFRFYAAVPVLDASGLALGALEILDVNERSLTSTQYDALRDLGGFVMTAMMSRRQALDLTRLPNTDYLTGIGNRAGFDKAVAIEIENARRSGTTFAVLCMDLDGFKAVNDRFGHPAGDEVLREVSRRLKDLVRKGDTLGRLGGDEFGIVLRNGDESSAQALLERIAEGVLEPIVLRCGAQVTVGISGGCAEFDQTQDSAELMLSLADQALYREKRKAVALRLVS